MELEKIGQGCSSVYRLRYADRAYAVKVRLLGDPPNQEAEIYRRLNHPSIVKCHGRFPADEFLREKVPQIEDYLLMDYVEGYQLRFLREDPEFSVEDAEFIIQWVFMMIAYLHLFRVSHNDLHLNNILRMSDGKLYLLDFEKSEIVPNNKPIGTRDVESGIKLAHELFEFIQKGTPAAIIDLKKKIDLLRTEMDPLECWKLIGQTRARL
jgi:serine/threonine protein kinase